jgi:hypothetical protein
MPLRTDTAHQLTICLTALLTRTALPIGKIVLHTMRLPSLRITQRPIRKG